MIVVHIPCDGTTTSYAQYCFEAMQCTSTKGAELRLELHTCPRHPKLAADNHCAAVREAFRSIEAEPEAVHVICDSDTVTVLQDWDVIISNAFEQFDCIGTAYQRAGTQQTGFGRKQTYKGKPNVEWLALKPGRPWYLFDPANTVRPEPLVVTTKEDEALWGLPWGTQLLTDACWNFPLFLREQGLTSYALENVEPKRYIALVGFGSYEEWHLDGVPFVVHQGKSRKNPFRSPGFSAEFYDRCDQLIKQK